MLGTREEAEAEEAEAGKNLEIAFRLLIGTHGRVGVSLEGSPGGNPSGG